MEAALGIKKLTVADLCTSLLAFPSPFHCAFAFTLFLPFRSVVLEYVFRSLFPYSSRLKRFWPRLVLFPSRT